VLLLGSVRCLRFTGVRCGSDASVERGVERNVVLDGLSSKDVATKISELLG
jgi:hypothetical protein